MALEHCQIQPMKTQTLNNHGHTSFFFSSYYFVCRRLSAFSLQALSIRFASGIGLIKVTAVTTFG